MSGSNEADAPNTDPRTPAWLVVLVAGAIGLECVLRGAAVLVDGDVATAARFFSAEQIALGREHLLPLRLLGHLQVAATAALFVFLGCSARGARFLHAIERRARGPRRTLAAYVVLAGVLLVALPLPFRLAARAHQLAWGLTAQELSDWLFDDVTATAIDASIQTGSLVVALLLLRAAPRRGFLVAGAVGAVGTTVATLLWPVLIAPMFNDITLISGTKYAHLESSLRALAPDPGLASVPIYVIDASRQGSGTNAQVTGLFSTMRIEMYDTLLDIDDRAAIQATFAHELGHWQLDHSTFDVAFYGAAIVIASFLLWRAAAALVGRTPLAPRSVSDPRNFFLFAVLVWAAATLGEPVAMTLSRSQEAAADAFGLALTNAPRSWITDERRGVLESYGDPVANPVRQLRATHPHGTERIARICRIAPAVCTGVKDEKVDERVHVTFAIDPRDEATLRQALGVAAEPDDVGTIFAFDTAAGDLRQRGVLACARRWQSGREESLIMLQGPDLVERTASWDGRQGFTRDRQIDGNDERISATITTRLLPGSITRMDMSHPSIETIFSIPQRRFAGAVPWTGIVAPVAISIRRWRTTTGGIPVVLERREPGNGDVVLSLSSTATTTTATTARRALDALVVGAGVRPAQSLLGRPSTALSSCATAP